MKQPAPHVSYCDICGKKLKGQTEHGLQLSIAKHYKFRHQKKVRVIDAESEHVIIKSPAGIERY